MSPNCLGGFNKNSHKNCFDVLNGKKVLPLGNAQNPQRVLPKFLFFFLKFRQISLIFFRVANCLIIIVYIST